MKFPTYLKKLTLLPALLAALSLPASAVFAAAPGQVEGGNIYRIQNVTKGADFTNQATADACDKLLYRMRIYNPGPSDLHNVKIEVNLTTSKVTTHSSTATISSDDGNPPSTAAMATVTVSTAQTVLYDSDASRGGVQLLDQNLSPVSSVSTDIFDGSKQANIGTLAASQVEYVQFPAIVSCPTTPPPPPAQPTYSCDALAISASENRTVKISNFATSAANGATFKNADISWGDGDSDSAQTTVIGRTHQYSKDGTYIIAATARFSVNGQDQTAAGPQCTASVTFKAGQPPKVTPPKEQPPAAGGSVTTAGSRPTTLVNTGPGSTAAIVIAAVVAGFLGYRWHLGRRLAVEPIETVDKR